MRMRADMWIGPSDLLWGMPIDATLDLSHGGGRIALRLSSSLPPTLARIPANVGGTPSSN